MDEMHLTKIGLGGIARHTREVLHGDTVMRIAFDAKAPNETDRGFARFAECMSAASGDRLNTCCHRSPPNAGSQIAQGGLHQHEIVTSGDRIPAIT